MHVSRQPNSERWVQSNSPFSLILRDRIDSNLAVAWSNLLAKAMPVKSWRPTVETESETEWENSEMEKKVSEGVSDLDQCEGEMVSESVRVCVCFVWERVSESGEWSVWGEVLFLKIAYLKSSVRDSVSLSSMWIT